MDFLPDLADLSDDEIRALVAGLPDHVVTALTANTTTGQTIPGSPLAQAQELDPKYRTRPHLEYLSGRIAQAVRDVENGQDRWMRISTPPRTGKSHLMSIFTPAWILRKHPDWKIGLLSHSPDLAASWGRQIRHLVESHPELGVEISRDAGAAAAWETTERGSVISRSIPGQSVTGYGFKILLVDDPVKDFASAHSETQRDALWDAWQSNIRSRLEPPSLVAFVGTRWHADDILGRLASTEHAGDPDDWEVIELPAIAEDNDILGREVGEPLLSPIIDETADQALKRWESIRVSVGSYNWSALYQQSPSPAEGAIFDIGWWRYWTLDPGHATDEVRLFTEADLESGGWLDSWDFAFKDTDDSDYVVGQRWVRVGPCRLLVDQSRDRRSFTGTITEMRRFSTMAPYSTWVHRRLIEDKANGPAVINSMSDKMSGIIPINPKTSKEARAWSVTPEIESHHVLLPNPAEPGNRWVTETYLPEFRDFPNGKNDDQVDATTQALADLRTVQGGGITNPDGRDPGGIRAARAQLGIPERPGSSRVSAARTDRRRMIR